MAGLYDDTPGLSDGTGLWRGRLGLFSGASGFINGSGGGAAYIDLYFSAGTYSVAGNGYTTLGSIPGFTFTRASLAMGYDATGKLTYGPSNEARESQASTLWTAAGTTPPTTTGGVTLLGEACTSVTFTSGSATGFAGSRAERVTGLGSTGVLARTPYVLSEYISLSRPLVGSERIVVYWTGYQASADLVLNAASSVAYVGAWVRGTNLFSAQATAGQIYPVVYLTNAVASDVTVYISRVQLEAVTYQTTPSTYYPTTTAAYYGPRLVYDPVTLASQGILVEEARTNLCLQSSDFATTWAVSNTTVATNTATDPTGTSLADTITEDSATNVHQVNQVIAKAASSLTYTMSLFAKYNGRHAQVLVRDSASGSNAASVGYNLQTGAVGLAAAASGTFSAASSTIQTLSNGWYRITLTFTTGTETSLSLRMYLDNGTFTAGGTGYTGNGTSGAFFWQAQFEAGTGASSPIPTTTASVTRAADVAAVTGLALSYPMTVAVEAYRGLDKATDEFWVQVDDGTSGNRVVIEVNPSDKLEAAMTTGGAGQGSSTSAASVTVGATSKAAARFATNSIASALNGTLSPEDTTATTPSGPANLRIGSNQSGQAQPMYPISRIRIYNRALSNAELQALTQFLLLQEDGYSILQEDNSYIWLE